MNTQKRMLSSIGPTVSVIVGKHTVYQSLSKFSIQCLRLEYHEMVFYMQLLIPKCGDVSSDSQNSLNTEG